MFRFCRSPVLIALAAALGTTHASAQTKSLSAASDDPNVSIVVVQSQIAETREDLQRRKQDLNTLESLQRIHDRATPAIKQNKLDTAAVNEDLTRLLTEWERLTAQSGKDNLVGAVEKLRVFDRNTAQSRFLLGPQRPSDFLRQFTGQDPQFVGLERAVAGIDTDDAFRSDYRSALEAGDKEFDRIFSTVTAYFNDDCARVLNSVRQQVLLFGAQPEPADAVAAYLGDYVAKCRALLPNRTVLLSYWDSMSTLVDKLSTVTRQAIPRMQEKISGLNARLRELEEKGLRREIGRTLIDDSAKSVIFYTLVFWTIIICIVVCAILAHAWLGIARKDGTVFNYTLFLEMVTVFVLTATILILGLAGKIQTEGLAALIGGISGYVLGRMTSQGQAKPA